MSGAGEQFEMLVQRAPRPPVRGGRTPRPPVRGGRTPRPPVRGGRTPRPPLTGGYETETHREYRLRGADLTRVGERHFGSTIWVSTVFLGIDHRFGGEGPPLLFETMIFGGPHDQSQYRCSTWQEAEHMHADACALVLGRGPQACAIATDQLDD
jgi:hypothetical protein